MSPRRPINARNIPATSGAPTGANGTQASTSFRIVLALAGALAAFCLGRRLGVGEDLHPTLANVAIAGGAGALLFRHATLVLLGLIAFVPAGLYLLNLVGLAMR